MVDRLTPERLRTERDKAAVEAAERAQQGRLLATLLTQAVKTWQGRIQSQIMEAVRITNRIAATEYKKQLECKPTNNPPPPLVSSFKGPAHLPVVDILELKPQIPARGRSNPAAVRVANAARAAEPRLRIGVDANGSVEVVKINYKTPPKQPRLTVEPSKFTNELIEDVVAAFVNEGLLGLSDDGSPESNDVPAAESAENSNGVTLEEVKIPAQPPLRVSDAAPTEQFRPQIIAAVRANKQSIELTANALLFLLDDKIKALSIPNSEESEAELKTYRDLKERVEAFLQAIAQLAADATKEVPAVKATISFSEGVKNWWTAKHVEICERGYDSGLFALGLGICYLAGAGGLISAVIPATVIKGKLIADVLSKLPSGDKKS